MVRPAPTDPHVTATQLYDALLHQLMAHPTWQLDTLIANMVCPLDAMDQTQQLAQLDQLKTWLDQFRPLSPAILSELKQCYDVRFTYNSNAIEGNTLTQSETELVLTKGITVGGKTLIEHLEVIGHKEAIDYIETLTQIESPIGEWEIRQIHSLVMRKISPSEAGRYRQLDVKAAGTNPVYPPHYLLPNLMAEFIQWLEIATADLHPIELATEAHYRFVSIHPFRDGNGRTGRLLMNLLLMRAGFPIAVISNQQRQVYIDALVYGQRSQDDTSYLLPLIMSAVRESLLETLSLVASAADSRSRGQPFYQELLAFLATDPNIP
jgi:Fic family protein